MASILVVDDEAVIAVELEESLRALGYDVAGLASSASEAIALAEEKNPDLILMDIVMPGEMDGIDAAREIQARFDIPVVFLSAYGDEENVSRAKELNPYGYLLKPHQDDQVKVIIELALAKKKDEKQVSTLLSREIKEQHEAIQDLHQLFDSLFHSAKNAIVLINRDGTIYSANPTFCQLFGFELKDLIGSECTHLYFEDTKDTLNHIIQGMEDRTVWFGEMVGETSSGATIPVEVVINQVNLADGYFYQVLVRDMSVLRELEKELLNEKRETQEMSMTLRNVLKSLNDEKEYYREDLAHKIKIDLLPTLDKMTREPSKDVRETYKRAIREHLKTLMQGTADSLDKHLLDLTPTEISVCRYIQSGRSTKEIADLMNISFETVQTHRKNIRKKLGLIGNKASLASFLQTIPSMPSN